MTNKTTCCPKCRHFASEPSRVGGLLMTCLNPSCECHRQTNATGKIATNGLDSGEYVLPSHTKQEEKVERWEDALLNLQGIDLENRQIQLPLYRLRGFIRQLLSHRDKEILSAIEGMKYRPEEGIDAEMEAHNSALDEVKKFITGK